MPPARPRAEWERLIAWQVGDEKFFWQTGPRGLQPADEGDPQVSLSCSPEVLARLASGELPVFIAIWATGDLHFEGSFADAFRLGFMFLSDRRKKRVVFLAHCFLNANTRFPGGCAFRGATEPLIQVILESGAGVVQMPCPEERCLGLEKELYGEVPEAKLRACFRDLAQVRARISPS